MRIHQNLSRPWKLSGERSANHQSHLEKLFDGLTLQQQDGEFKYSSLVNELSGIIQLEENYDYKADYASYVEHKYE